MGASTTTTLNDLVGQIVSSEAQSAAYAFRVMRPVVYSKEVPMGAGSIVIPRFQALTPAALSQGVAPTAETWSTDGVTLTPVERGVLVSISKSALWADPFTDIEPYANQMGRALASDEDKNILSLVKTLTAVENDQANSANAMDLDDFLSAISKLEVANAPAPYYAVFHPVSWAKIRKAISDAAAYARVGTLIVEGFGEGQTSQAGYVGSPYGVSCYMSSGVETVAADPGVAVAYYCNLVASKECLGYAYTYDLRVDTDDNIPGRAIDCMAWYAGDQKVLVNSWGVRVEDVPAV